MSLQGRQGPIALQHAGVRSTLQTFGSQNRIAGPGHEESFIRRMANGCFLLLGILTPIFSWSGEAGVSCNYLLA